MKKDIEFKKGILEELRDDNFNGIVSCEIHKNWDEMLNSFSKLEFKRCVSNKPEFYFNQEQFDRFIEKGYFKNGELTEKGIDNIEELLPYLH